MCFFLFSEERKDEDMTEQERCALEEEIRAKIAEEKRAEQRAYKAEWRKKNREHIRQYNKVYRLRKKLCGEVEHNGE